MKIIIVINNCQNKSSIVLFIVDGRVGFLLIVVPFIFIVLFIIEGIFTIFKQFNNYFSIKVYLLYILLQIFDLNFILFIVFFFVSLNCFWSLVFYNFHLLYFISSLNLICLNFKE